MRAAVRVAMILLLVIAVVWVSRLRGHNPPLHGLASAQSRCPFLCKNGRRAREFRREPPCVQ